MEWFYVVNDQKAGPVSEDQFQRLVSNNTISSDTLVWNQNFPDWQVCATACPQFFQPRTPADDSEARSEDSKLKVRRPNVQGGATGAINPTVPRYEQVKQRLRYLFNYQGTAGDLFPLYLKNILLTVVTLGIYRFWADVAIRKYHYQHTTFADGRFDYHATGKEKFIGFLKGILALLPIGAISGLAYFLLQRSNPEFAATIAFYAFLFVMFLLRPLIICGARAYNLSRTSWNNLRFRFTGSVRELYGIFIRDTFLLIITLGIYYAWHEIRVKRFVQENTQFGGERFGYDGSGGDLFTLYFVNGFLTYITLGIYGPWAFAKIHRYHMDHSTYQGARFRCSLTGGQVFGTGLLCWFAIMFSLGLAFPWAIAKWKHLITNTTYSDGLIDFGRLIGSQDSSANAFAEGLGEAGEALETLSELIGG